MTMNRRETMGLMGAALVASTLPAAGRADGHAAKVIEVQLVNKHPEDPKERMVFFPAVIRANPGDTIKFVAVDKGHNTEANMDMLPSGAEGWKSKIGEDFEVTVGTDGTYGFHCTPHRSVGMVGLILVGDAMSNFEDVRAVRQRGRAKKRYEAYFAEAEAILTT